jgi:hypothetical protein
MSKHKPPKQSLGGRARAAKLAPEERSRIAREAAAKRWGSKHTDSEQASEQAPPEPQVRMPDSVPLGDPRGPMQKTGKKWKL